MSDTGDDPTRGATDAVRLTAWLTGQVQGVGMRWWVRSRALELGLVGSASNRPDGRVEVVAEGPRDALETLLDQLRSPQPTGRPGRVDAVAERWGEARGGLEGFRER